MIDIWAKIRQLKVTTQINSTFIWLYLHIWRLNKMDLGKRKEDANTEPFVIVSYSGQCNCRYHWCIFPIPNGLQNVTCSLDLKNNINQDSWRTLHTSTLTPFQEYDDLWCEVGISSDYKGIPWRLLDSTIWLLKWTHTSHVIHSSFVTATGDRETPQTENIGYDDENLLSFWIIFIIELHFRQR